MCVFSACNIVWAEWWKLETFTFLMELKLCNSNQHSASVTAMHCCVYTYFIVGFNKKLCHWHFQLWLLCKCLNLPVFNLLLQKHHLNIIYLNYFIHFLLEQWETGFLHLWWSLSTSFSPLHSTSKPCRTSVNVICLVFCGLPLGLLSSSSTEFMATFADLSSICLSTTIQSHRVCLN